MLHTDYRYIGIDFETTGLDLYKDVPIQIGIVEINVQGEVIDEFQSFIKPEKDIKELKNIVQFITKIEVAQLVFAPSIEEILPQISHFFDEKTIIIGHNVQFDVNFLERFLPSLSYHAVFDTFQFAQALIPYPPSFALEILLQHLESKPLFLEWKTNFGLGFSVDEEGMEQESSFHDAYYDTKGTLALFCYLFDYSQRLAKEYPVLAECIQKSDALLARIFPQTNSRSLGIGKISLPPLKKVAPQNTSITSFPYEIDVEQFPSGERYYIGNTDLKDLLISLLANKKTMLVFATKPKLDIAKNILNQVGIKNIGFAREEQTISPTLFMEFLNKEVFNQFELYFVLKYCSHLYLGYGVLDLNSKGDYMVYNFIKDERQIVKYPIVLTTHHGLYSILEKEAHVYADFDIVFFDLEWWYRNYNAYLSRSCDLYYIQNFIDMLVYKYGLLDEFQNLSLMKWENLQSISGDLGSEESFVDRDSSLRSEGQIKGITILQEFDTFFTMFIGILWTETKKLFIGRAEDFCSINPIIGSLDFHQTNTLIPKLKDFEQPLSEVLSPQDFTTLRKQIEHFLSICDTVAKVQRKLWAQSDFYFLFSEDTKFTNRDEFREIFKNNHILFASNHEQAYPKLVDIPDPQRGILMRAQTATALEAKISATIEVGGSAIFIISTVKEESRAIFEQLQKMKNLSDFELLAENITGGAGKNIFKAKKKLAKIIVGGYNFLMMCYAQGLVFDETIIWNVRGAQANLILDDVLWYAAKNVSD
ncbi:MAG: 3'-5' exonuclease [Candidatus Absconditabacteria bacterium]|nr:3'-5' exonuclease [Candidatus Absconditabacteria bacterium]MDD3868493.1 3'-5' exonuclease [Candidatus Absconditabacteria bacterium]